MAACCSSCAKGFLVIFNIFLLLTGLAPLILGLIALVDADTFSKILQSIPGSSAAEQLLTNSAAYLIVLGVIVFTIGLLGWFGACYEAKEVLIAYLLLLLALIAAEVIIVILAVVFPTTFYAGGHAIMRKTLQGLQDCAVYENGTVVCPQTDALGLGIHVMQYELRCCGAKDYTDYGSLEWTARYNTYNNTATAPATAPLTCCKLFTDSTTSKPKFPPLSTDESSCYGQGFDKSQYVTKGCFDAVLAWIVSSAMMIIIMSTIGGLEVVLFLATVVLLCKKSNAVGHKDNVTAATRRVRWADDYGRY